MKEELLEDIKRHIDYTNAMNQKSMRDLQLENLFNYYNELQERIDKVRKYLSTLKTYPFMEKFYIKDVENILRGDDNE